MGFADSFFTQMHIMVASNATNSIPSIYSFMMVSSRRTLFEYEDTHSLRPIKSHFIQRGGAWCLFSPDSVLSLDAEQEARSEILDVLDTKTVSLLDILHEVTWKDYLYNDTNCQMGLIVITFDLNQSQHRGKITRCPFVFHNIIHCWKLELWQYSRDADNWIYHLSGAE